MKSSLSHPVFCLAILCLLMACSQESSSQDSQAWKELQSKLSTLQDEDNEAHLVSLAQEECSDFQNLCTKWFAQQLISYSHQEGQLHYGPGRGELIARYLLSHSPQLKLGRQTLARELLLQGDIEESRQIFTSLLNEDPEGAFELYWLIQLETQDHQYEEAEEYTKRFELLGVEEAQISQGLQYQIQVKKEKQELKEELNYTLTQHFEIYSEANHSQAEWVGEVIESQWERLTQYFGLTLIKPIEVVIYQQSHLGGAAAEVDWVSASYNGKLRIPISQIPESLGESSQGFSQLMSHELTHALLDKGIGQDIPVWFHEGMAQYMEGRRFAQIKHHLAGQSIPTLEQLNRPFLEVQEQSEVSKRYSLSLAMVEQIIEDSSEESFQNLISLGSQNSSFEEAWGLIFPGDHWKVSALYKRAIQSLSQEHKP